MAATPAPRRLPGMTDRANWRQTPVHKATKWYACARCGARFGDPIAVYNHIDVRHPHR